MIVRCEMESNIPESEGDPVEILLTAYETGWHTQDGKPGANADTRHRAGLRAVAAAAWDSGALAFMKGTPDERGQIVVMNPYRATVNSELTVRQVDPHERN